MTQAYNKRVSELTAATSATEGDTLYLVKDGASRKISVRDLIDSAVLSTSAGVRAATIAYFAGLPTSDSGLSVGDFYWNGGVLCRVEP